MSLIKFIQIGCTIRNGGPTFLKMVQRAKIPYAVSFMYISGKDSQDNQAAPYGFHEATTVVMIDKRKVHHWILRYVQDSQVSGKIIILLPATGSQREFNLGMAVGSASLLEPGVYVSDKGKVSKWSEY